MALKDFDQIVDIIEKNVKEDWILTQKELSRSLGMTMTDIGKLFKEVSGNTLGLYFKERKAYNLMWEIYRGPENMSIVNYVEDNGYTEYSVFFKQIKKLTGKNPEEIKNQNSFAIPSVKHLDKYWDYEDEASLKAGKVVLAGTSENERMDLVNSIYQIRKEISELESELRECNENNKAEEIKGFIYQSKNLLKVWEEQLNHIDYKVQIQKLTPALYMEFLRIEECRVLYGLDINTAISFYNESIERDINLESLCDIRADEMLGEDNISEEEWDEEEFYQMQDYELNLAESWNLYYGDDEEPGYDPYDTSDEEEHKSLY